MPRRRRRLLDRRPGLHRHRGQRARRPAARQVAGAIQAPARSNGERIGQEPLGREVRPAVVAARHAGPAHPADRLYPGAPLLASHEPNGRPCDPGVKWNSRYRDIKSCDPQYVFGYGLSYSQFEVTNLRLSGENAIARTVLMWPSAVCASDQSAVFQTLR